MSDVVVTCPKGLWFDWIEEGDLPGDWYDGENEYHFFLRGGIPDIVPGERVYVVAHGLLRGYAPLVRIDTRRSHGRQPWWWPGADCGLVRHGDAVAVTIPEAVRGFQGFRYRWWERDAEVPFPDWDTKGVPA